MAKEAYKPQKGDIILLETDGSLYILSVSINSEVGKVDYNVVGLSLERIRQEQEERDKKIIKAFENELFDLYHKLGKVNVWGKSNDVLCDDCQKYAEKALRRAFTSVDLPGIPEKTEKGGGD